MVLEITARHRAHAGTLHYARHPSAATGTPMRLSVWTPDGPGPFPYLVWLSGLTCTEENFTTKAGAYAHAARHGLAIVAPDTSARGDGVADAPGYDLGQGAGFYLDATEPPWSAHFRMEAYVVDELPRVVEATFPLDGARRGVFGHSMGGHGALTLALRNPALFASVSAFSPIASPTRCPWGVKALAAYLGEDRTRWAEHDASRLIEAGRWGRFDRILVDQGTADSFLETQLKPELLEEAAAKAGRAVEVRRQPGYDHSYFFIASFIADHVAFHAARL
jgi:S-formylglutathione hydrolase